MTRFEFLEFFGPQLIFIGEWGTKFDFLDFFYQKNNQIYIQTASPITV
jgi:hypothetical protein